MKEFIMDLSVIIINWNTRELLMNCIHSVYNTLQGQLFEIWVVDNGSSDGSPEAVQRQFPDIHLIQNQQNLGFAAANNQAFRKNGWPLRAAAEF